MNKECLNEQLTTFLMDQSEDEKSHNTQKKYAHNIKMFIEWLPDNLDVDKSTVIAFKQHLLDDLHFRTNTINNYIVSINKFLYYCGIQNCKVKQLKKQHAASNSEILSLSDYKRMLRIAKRIGQEDTYLILSNFRRFSSSVVLA